jgi:hypothetical protein
VLERSAQYAADFAEVRDYGGAVSLRSGEQTATALFHTVAPGSNTSRTQSFASDHQLVWRPWAGTIRWLHTTV